MTELLIVGDSVVYGSWDPERSGWATRVRQRIDQATETVDEIIEVLEDHTEVEHGHPVLNEFE